MKPSAQPAYAPSWYTDTMVAAPARAPLTSDLDIEVCVIGAGLAGLTAAREIARRGFPVAVVEARRIAWNASGRNTGFVLPGFALSMDVVTRRVGLAHAKALWALSEMGLDYVRATIAETGMPGAELTEGGWLKVSKTGAIEDDLAEVRLIGQEFGAPVEGWPFERVREVLKSRAYFHGVHFPQAFAIHPLNYALGLAAAAEAAGARIFEDTPAIQIDPDGVRKRVVTPFGLVRAHHIVLAGNVHLGAVLPMVSGTLVPISTYVVTTAPLGARLDAAISYPGTVSDTERADNHYRIVGGDRLMWSGGMTTWSGDPRRYVRQLQADIARVYPQLGEVAIEHAWTGTLGNTLHRMPQIGELIQNVWLASGFGGHGLNTTAMAGNIVARGLVENDDTWRRFLPFELIWAGGRAGRAAAQVNYWWYHARELYAARKAREREAAQRRGEGEAAHPASAEAAGGVQVAVPMAAAVATFAQAQGIEPPAASVTADAPNASSLLETTETTPGNDGAVAAIEPMPQNLADEPAADPIVESTELIEPSESPLGDVEPTADAPTAGLTVSGESTPAAAAADEFTVGAPDPIEQVHGSPSDVETDAVAIASEPTQALDQPAALQAAPDEPVDGEITPAAHSEIPRDQVEPAIAAEAAEMVPNSMVRNDAADDQPDATITPSIPIEPVVVENPREPPPPSAVDRALDALSQFGQAVAQSREPSGGAEASSTGKDDGERGRSDRRS